MFYKYSKLILPLIFLVSAEALLIWPQSFYYIVGGLNLIFLISFYSFFKKKFLKYFALLFLVINSLILYLSLSVNGFFIQTLIFLVLIFLYFYLKLLYQESWLKLRTFSFYFSILGIFFISAFLLNLQIFINIVFWKILLIWLAFIVITVFSNFVFTDFKSKDVKLFTFLNSFLIFEIAAILYFLPLDYDILALMLAILYYCLNGLTWLYLNSKLERKVIKNYVILTILGLVFILLSSKWM